MKFSIRGLLAGISILLLPAVTFAQTGAVAGRVLDQATRTALPGAAIVVEGTSLSAVSDRDGRFHIAGVAAGRATVVVSYIGGADTGLWLQASPARKEGTVEVRGRGAEGSGRNIAG